MESHSLPLALAADDDSSRQPDDVMPLYPLTLQYSHSRDGSLSLPASSPLSSPSGPVALAAHTVGGRAEEEEEYAIMMGDVATTSSMSTHAMGESQMAYPSGSTLGELPRDLARTPSLPSSSSHLHQPHPLRFHSASPPPPTPFTHQLSEEARSMSPQLCLAQMEAQLADLKHQQRIMTEQQQKQQQLLHMQDMEQQRRQIQQAAMSNSLSILSSPVRPLPPMLHMQSSSHSTHSTQTSSSAPDLPSQHPVHSFYQVQVPAPPPVLDAANRIRSDPANTASRNAPVATYSDTFVSLSPQPSSSFGSSTPPGVSSSSSTASRKRDRSSQSQGVPERPPSSSASFHSEHGSPTQKERNATSSTATSQCPLTLPPTSEEEQMFKRCRSASPTDNTVPTIQFPLKAPNTVHTASTASSPVADTTPIVEPKAAAGSTPVSAGADAALGSASAPGSLLTAPRRIHHRRKTDELLPHEMWLCPYADTARGTGCGKIYRTSSSRSISKHLTQCRFRPADTPPTDHLPPGQTNAMHGAHGLRDSLPGVLASAVQLRKQKHRRKSSELAAHERWNCPYQCGQFFRSTSTKSIHNHRLVCEKRPSDASPMPAEEMAAQELAQIDRLRQQQEQQKTESGATDSSSTQPSVAASGDMKDESHEVKSYDSSSTSSDSSSQDEEEDDEEEEEETTIPTQMNRRLGGPTAHRRNFSDSIENQLTTVQLTRIGHQQQQPQQQQNGMSVQPESPMPQISSLHMRTPHSTVESLSSRSGSGMDTSMTGARSMDHGSVASSEHMDSAGAGHDTVQQQTQQTPPPQQQQQQLSYQLPRQQQSTHQPASLQQPLQQQPNLQMRFDLPPFQSMPPAQAPLHTSAPQQPHLPHPLALGQAPFSHSSFSSSSESSSSWQPQPHSDASMSTHLHRSTAMSGQSSVVGEFAPSTSPPPPTGPTGPLSVHLPDISETESLLMEQLMTKLADLQRLKEVRQLANALAAAESSAGAATTQSMGALATSQMPSPQQQQWSLSKFDPSQQRLLQQQMQMLQQQRQMPLPLSTISPVAGVTEDPTFLLRMMMQQQDTRLLMQQTQLLHAQQQQHHHHHQSQPNQPNQQQQNQQPMQSHPMNPSSDILSPVDFPRPDSSASVRSLANDMANIQWSPNPPLTPQAALQHQYPPHHRHAPSTIPSMSPSPTDITFAQLAAFLPFGGSGLPSASPPPMLANAADGRFFPGPLAATAVARNGGTTAGAVPTKKSIKSRRVGSQLPLHERWTCPLKCGKFFKKSSSNSIRRHSMQCLTALHEKSSPVTPVTNEELQHMLTSGVDRSMRKRAPGAAPPSEATLTETGLIAGDVSHTSHADSFDDVHHHSAAHMLPTRFEMPPYGGVDEMHADFDADEGLHDSHSSHTSHEDGSLSSAEQTAHA